MTLMLRGKAVADSVMDGISARIVRLASRGKVPCLATLRVGGSPDDASYERALAKTGAALGIEVMSEHFQEDVPQEKLIARVQELNKGASVDGCMVFRPLPSHMDERAVCDAIAPSKDVDCVGAESLSSVFMGLKSGFAPATAEACIAILDHYNIGIEGFHVVVVGRSLVIGKPVGMLALSRNATVTYCHSRTSGLRSIVRSADIVVCAVGRAAFFDRSYFREGQVVLDVGMNVDEGGRLCGDVDFDAVKDAVAAITPVPGGVGAVTTPILLGHVVESAERSA